MAQDECSAKTARSLGTDDAKYFRYDIYGRKTWEIGPLGANGFRNARKFTYRDADDKLTDARKTAPSSIRSSPTLTVHTQTNVGYDNHRNPSSEAVVATANADAHSALVRRFGTCSTAKPAA